VSLDFVKFSTSVEVRALAEGDVGIMPLPDTPTSRGKCGLKALQYMAVGRATVVSPVGINREIIRDGENGLWADTTEEWVAQLERLARDPVLRQRLADAGRRTIETGYTARHSANAFAAAVRSAVKSGTADPSLRSG
jgi:glycosyltransferase involved in cell wall biosynthesis